ncbi:MAG: anaerobic ribonucleoside-triphosphate reductase activating protein [Candidatus Omnitrophota bacterium]
MKIAGLQSLSLVDYPGCLAAAVFTQGCNFHCGYCHNPGLISPEGSGGCSEEDVFSEISARKNTIEGVTVTGGEPTIQKGLPDFADKIKDMGFKFKLDTNGSNPAAIESMLKAELIDYIAVDIKTSFPKYNLVTGIKGIARSLEESIFLTMLSTARYEFRITCVPGLVEETDIELIGGTLKGAEKIVLQQFRPYRTYDRKFQSIEPYGKETLKNFQKIMENYARHVDLRGF